MGNEARFTQAQLPAYHLINLSQSIHGTNEIINKLVYPLAGSTLEDYNNTLVGTSRKNKREISLSFLPIKSQFSYIST
jgi:hypothetical protein